MREHAGNIHCEVATRKQGHDERTVTNDERPIWSDARKETRHDELDLSYKKVCGYSKTNAKRG